MTALLGKVTSEYKLIGCLIKIPWYVVSDSSVHIIYRILIRKAPFIPDHFREQ